MVQWQKIYLPMKETWVQSLGQKDPLEKEMATHSNILAWKNATDREAWWAYSPWGRKESDMTELLSTMETKGGEQQLKPQA